MKESKSDVIALLIICLISAACMITVIVGCISLLIKA
jgi:hypothetical protein